MPHDDGNLPVFTDEQVLMMLTTIANELSLTDGTYETPQQCAQTLADTKRAGLTYQEAVFRLFKYTEHYRAYEHIGINLP